MQNGATRPGQPGQQPGQPRLPGQPGGNNSGQPGHQSRPQNNGPIRPAACPPDAPFIKVQTKEGEEKWVFHDRVNKKFYLPLPSPRQHNFGPGGPHSQGGPMRPQGRGGPNGASIPGQMGQPPRHQGPPRQGYPGDPQGGPPGLHGGPQGSQGNPGFSNFGPPPHNSQPHGGPQSRQVHHPSPQVPTINRVPPENSIRNQISPNPYSDQNDQYRNPSPNQLPNNQMPGHTGVYSLFWAGDFVYDEIKNCFVGKNLTKKMAQPLFRLSCANFEP